MKEGTGEGGKRPRSGGRRRRRNRSLNSSEMCCTLCRLYARVMLCRRPVCCQRTRAEEELSNAATGDHSSTWELGEEPCLFCGSYVLLELCRDFFEMIENTFMFFIFLSTCHFSFSTLCSPLPRRSVHALRSPARGLSPSAPVPLPRPYIAFDIDTISSVVLVCFHLFFFFRLHSLCPSPSPLRVSGMAGPPPPYAPGGSRPFGGWAPPAVPKWQTRTGTAMGAVMWLWIFYRAKNDLPHMLVR